MKPLGEYKGPKTEIPLELLEDLMEVCSWYQTQVDAFFHASTPQTHHDVEAVRFLRSESVFIQRAAKQVIDRGAKEGEK